MKSKLGPKPNQTYPKNTSSNVDFSEILSLHPNLICSGLWLDQIRFWPIPTHAETDLELDFIYSRTNSHIFNFSIFKDIMYPELFFCLDNKYLKYIINFIY